MGRYMSPSRGSSPVRSLGRSPSTAGFDMGSSGASGHPSGRGGQSRLGPGGGERNIKTVWVGQVQQSQHPAVTAVCDVFYAQPPINLAIYHHWHFLRCHCCDCFGFELICWNCANVICTLAVQCMLQAQHCAWHIIEPSGKASA